MTDELAVGEAGEFGALVAPSFVPLPPQLSEAQWAILDHLSKSDVPFGARTLTGLLHDEYPASEATISRWLAALDEKGLTRRMGSKGRTITAKGNQLATARRMQRAHQRRLSEALDLSSVSNVTDLLVARRAVESEAARMAARHAGPAELRQLEALLGQHKDTLVEGTVGRQCALEFHRYLARCSENPMLITLCETVLGKHLDYLEQFLDMVTLSHGSYEVSAGDHEAILVAVANRDEMEAERLMRNHLTRLIDELEAYRNSAAGGAFSSMLKIVRQQG